jgi:cation:H+ antiporter
LKKGWLWIAGALLVTVPGVGAQLAGLHLDKENPTLAAVLLGVAVVGAAFLLSWACEVAEKDIPPALALSVLALIAVLPEYAVDFSLTLQAGKDPTYREYAVANMIGANRMIVGFAWPLIIFLFWLRFRKKRVYMDSSQRVEIGFLLLAGLYSLIIPIKGHIDLYDFVVLVGLFVVYTWRISKAEVHEPELIGPAEVLGNLATGTRRISVLALTVYAAAVIFIAAHPFAESLIHTGTALGIDEVFMVQWFAPLASEAPEIVVTILFTLRGLASAGLGALVASKVNQWTLLVGTLPLVFSLGAGRLQPLPLSEHQIGSMLVTSGQTLLATMILINLSASLRGAAILFGLLVAQFFVPVDMSVGDFKFDTHFLFGTIYLAGSLLLAARHPKDFGRTFRAMLNKPVPEDAEIEAKEEAQTKEAKKMAQGEESSPVRPA